MCGIQPVAMLFQNLPRRIQRFCRPAQVARSECNFGLGNHTSRAGHGFFRTERPCGTSQKRLRSREIPELRHRDAAKRQRRRILTQRNSFQCAERIARRERASRCRDY